MFQQVLHCQRHDLDVVLELAEARVAVEAQDPADLARLVVVVNMRPVERSLADTADTALRLDHRRDISLTDAVPTLQVVVPRAAMQSLFGLTAVCVVALLAIERLAIAAPSVVAEVVEWLYLLTTWAMLESRRSLDSLTQFARLA